MAPRPVTREKLCELFWDVADDPRSELRWCLSKLRPLVDAPTTTRLIADRAQVHVWSDDSTLSDPDISRAGGRALDDYVAALLAVKEEQPVVDLCSTLAAARTEGRLTDAEAIGTASLIPAARSLSRVRTRATACSISSSSATPGAQRAVLSGRSPAPVPAAPAGSPRLLRVAKV